MPPWKSLVTSRVAHGLGTGEHETIDGEQTITRFDLRAREGKLARA